MLPATPPAAPIVIIAAETTPRFSIRGVWFWPYARVAGLSHLLVCVSDVIGSGWFLHISLGTPNTKEHFMRQLVIHEDITLELRILPKVSHTWGFDIKDDE